MVTPPPTLGIDVQGNRPHAWALLDAHGEHVGSGLVPTTDLVELAKLHSRGGLTVGIDAPRCPLLSPRTWFYRNGSWRPRRKERGHGRHCEVAVKALGLANPQWTPLASDPTPPWMTKGFRLFAELAEFATVLEVFPTASIAALGQGGQPAPASVDLSLLGIQRQDSLDAVIAAWTARAFLMGQGSEVGGGDGLGTIVLPCAVKGGSPALGWPGELER